MRQGTFKVIEANQNMVHTDTIFTDTHRHYQSKTGSNGNTHRGADKPKNKDKHDKQGGTE